MDIREFRNLMLVGVVALVIGLGVAGILLNRPPARLAPATPLVRLDPADVRVAVGRTFTLSLQVDAPTNLGAYQVDLLYDPDVVQVITVTLSPLLSSTGRTAAPLGPLTRNAGRTTFAGYSYGQAPGVSQAGTLAQIRLRANRPGSTTLRLDHIQLTDPQANLQPAQAMAGQVEVTAPYSVFLPVIVKLR
jgi:general secretion pathway protein D